MGVENANLCFCNAAGPINSAVLAPETDCNITCAGNGAENCGAGSRLNVYQMKTSGSAKFAGSRRGIEPMKKGWQFKVW